MRMTIASAPPAQAAAIRKLAVDAMACEVLRALADDRVPSFLLKGMTLQPLYGDERARVYRDVDLMVPSADLPRARAALSRLAFERPLDPLRHRFRTPQPHSEDWRRGYEAVDLHWRFAGINASAEATWRVLAARTRAIAVGTEETRALDESGVALLLALHAADHGKGRSRALEDLSRGVDRLGPESWAQAAGLARELDALDAFGAGLRMLPAGAGLASELCLPEPSSTRIRLRAAEQPPAADGVLTLIDTPWRRGKARALVDALFPGADFMRACFPLAKRGRAGLALAYLVRGARRARQLPTAVRAVRQAREP
jgi:hypothetical protein